MEKSRASATSSSMNLNSAQKPFNFFTKLNLKARLWLYSKPSLRRH